MLTSSSSRPTRSSTTRPASERDQRLRDRPRRARLSSWIPSTNDGAFMGPHGCSRWQSAANRSGERTEETSQNRCRSRDRPRGVHGKEEVEGSSPSKLFGGSHCSVPALPVEAVKDIELSHGIGRQPRPRHTMSTRQPRSLSASRCPPGYPRRAKRATSPATMQCSETAVEPKSLQIRRFMAPGGIEPPHAASKAAALSAELRGPEPGSVSRYAFRARWR
jgi:hypothetical protein